METLETEKKRKGVLLVATPLRLLARLTTRSIIHRNSWMSAPPVFEEFNFVENGFPYRIRFFVWESKLYTVGGEKPLEGIPSEQLFSLKHCHLDESFGVGGASPYIYVSDTTLLDSIIDFRKLSTTMLGPKPNPFIAAVQGKIYVLSEKPYYYCEVDL